jgi:hypothetical protein
MAYPHAGNQVSLTLPGSKRIFIHTTVRWLSPRGDSDVSNDFAKRRARQTALLFLSLNFFQYRSKCNVYAG